MLPREAFQEIILILRKALPPPVTEDASGYARRDRAAMLAVAALLPENAAEGRLAAQFVVADACALDCLLLARVRRGELEVARQCRAQAMGLMREAKSALRMLLRLQARRQAIEADEAALGRAAWAEHGAMGMMRDALSDVALGVLRPGLGRSGGGGKALGDGVAAPAALVGKFGLGARGGMEALDSRLETESGVWPPAFVGS